MKCGTRVKTGAPGLEGMSLKMLREILSKSGFSMPRASRQECCKKVNELVASGKLSIQEKESISGKAGPSSPKVSSPVRVSTSPKVQSPVRVSTSPKVRSPVRVSTSPKVQSPVRIPSSPVRIPSSPKVRSPVRMECGKYVRKNGNPLERLTIPEMKKILASIGETSLKGKREDFCSRIRMAIQKGLLAVKYNLIVPSTLKEKSPTRSSKGKSPTRSSNGKSPTRSSNGKSPTRSSNGKSPTRSSKGKSPINSSKGKSPISSSKGKSPISSSNGKSPTRSSKSSIGSPGKSVSPEINSPIREPPKKDSFRELSLAKSGEKQVLKVGNGMKKFQNALSETFGGAIVRGIGRGAFGVVAKCLIRGETYAVKFISIDWDTDVDSIREVYYSNLFSHPNIVKYVGFSIAKQENMAVIVMKMATSDLGGYLTNVNNIISRNDSVRIMYKIGMALDYIHRGGFVHCDLKPYNILMYENDELKIADLGFVRLKQTVPSNGRKRPSCQTSVYRPPEQYYGNKYAKNLANYGYEDVNESWTTDNFQAEYWAYGVMCLEILYNSVELFAMDMNNDEGYIDFLNGAIAKGRVEPQMIIKLFGRVDRGSEDILDLICLYLLNLDQPKRDLMAFLQAIHPIQEKDIIPFRQYQIQSYIPPTANVILRLERCFDEIKFYSRSMRFPRAIILHSLDYLVQHIHLHLRVPTRLLVAVILFLMQSICNVINDVYRTVDFTKPNFAVDINEFKDLAIELSNGLHGLEFESLYYLLPSDDLVDIAIRDILNNPEKYMSYKNPRRYSEYLLQTYEIGEPVKTDKSFVL